MKEFILENYKLIISGILVLISTIVFILRKKPVDDILTWIYTHCIKAVNLVESESEVALIKGDVKLQRAVAYVCSWLSGQFPELNCESYRKIITKVIEEILSTPEKKKGGTSDAR